MTIQVANALYRYFETLYNLNQSLIILCGVDVIDNKGHYEKYIEDIVQAVPRLVPYARIKNSTNYKIMDRDGLMEFTAELPFLKNDYESILLNHGIFLDKIKKIRNKLEHQMHGARIVASMSGSQSLLCITYTVSGEEIDLKAQEIIAFVKELNGIFTKIQNLADHFACDKGLNYHPYYWKLVRYTFTEFNKIYDSNLLRIFGKAMLPF